MVQIDKGIFTASFEELNDYFDMQDTEGIHAHVKDLKTMTIKLSEEHAQIQNQIETSGCTCGQNAMMLEILVDNMLRNKDPEQYTDLERAFLDKARCSRASSVDSLWTNNVEQYRQSFAQEGDDRSVQTDYTVDSGISDVSVNTSVSNPSPLSGSSSAISKHSNDSTRIHRTSSTDRVRTIGHEHSVGSFQSEGDDVSNQTDYPNVSGVSSVSKAKHPSSPAKSLFSKLKPPKVSSKNHRSSRILSIGKEKSVVVQHADLNVQRERKWVITGLCQITAIFLAVCDGVNRSVKILSTETKIVVSTLMLNSYPHGITSIGEKIVVTLPNKHALQFMLLSSNGDLKQDGYVDVGGECTSITYFNDQLVVLLIRPKGQIQIFGKNGKAMSIVVSEDTDSLFCDPLDFAIYTIDEETYVYATHSNLCSISVYTIGGDKKDVYQSKVEKGCFDGIAVDTKGVLYMCNPEANSVVTFNPKLSKKFHVVLDSTNGLNTPCSISYWAQEDKPPVFHVGMADGHVKAFSIH